MIRTNPPYTLIASDTITRAQHDNKTALLHAAAGLTVTLPKATGSGARYRFVARTEVTSNSYKIQVANAVDVLAGGIFINDTGDSTAATADFYPTASTSDTITLAASAGAGKVGDWVEIEDIASGVFAVRGALSGETDPANPFSAAVS